MPISRSESPTDSAPVQRFKQHQSVCDDDERPFISTFNGGVQGYLKSGMTYDNTRKPKEGSFAYVSGRCVTFFPERPRGITTQGSVLGVTASQHMWNPARKPHDRILGYCIPQSTDNNPGGGKSLEVKRKDEQYEIEDEDAEIIVGDDVVLFQEGKWEGVVANYFNEPDSRPIPPIEAGSHR